MALNSEIEVVGVDWGTTHRRAYGLSGRGDCIAEYADDQGALASQGRFAQSLAQLLDAMQAQPRAVVLCGMVGSALGWRVAPYVDGSVALTELGQHTLALDDAGIAARTVIVPGYCVRSATGQPDVMRGEEAQLLGAHCMGHSEGWFVLPGTHSKWVELRDGRVLQLRTYMTGELFDLLSKHGTLAAAAGNSADAWDAAAFAQGVMAVRAGGALGNHLFSCRARVVSGDMPAASSRAYLSGLLIGSELHDVLQRGQTPDAGSFQLIGSAALARHYQTAADLLGVRLNVLDARAAFIAATHHLYRQGGFA